MPELPDVEEFRKYVDSSVLGKQIESVDVLDSRVLENISPANLKKSLKERKLLHTTRHGKHLFLDLDRGGSLHVHFGMTGSLESYSNSEDEPRC